MSYFSGNRVEGGGSTSPTSPTSSDARKALIAVIGAAGSGKSSLISDITGQQEFVGHNMHPGRAKVMPYEVTIGNTTLVLVDTPGFGDTSLSDGDVLKAIAKWLKETYDRGYRLNGLVYLHQINNARMEGSARRALHIFQMICGEDNYRNVILATTFWNKVEPGDHEVIEREQSLIQNEGFWKSMRDAGASMVRLDRNYKDILPALLNIAQQPKVTLDIQSQLKSGIPLEMTMAGLYVRDERQALGEEHEAAINRPQENFGESLRQQHREQAEAPARHHHNIIGNQEQERIEADRRRRNEMREQAETLERNQRAREAEQAVRIQQQQENDRRVQEWRAEEERISKQEAQQNQARMRHALSQTIRRKIEQQLETFRTLRKAGVARIAVPGILADGSASRSGLNSWCDFCLKPFGMGQVILCQTCAIGYEPGAGELYGICIECHQDGQRCFNGEHTMRLADHYGEITNISGGICRRLLDPFGVQCDVVNCKKIIEGIYFHCCRCSEDDLDICVDCVEKGYHCYDPQHQLQWGVQPDRFSGFVS